MSPTENLIPAFTQMLRALTAWLDKGVAFAAERGDDPDHLLSLRLAPDMYPLAAQIRFAAFQAQEAAHRLSGRPLPEALEEMRREGWNAGDEPGSFAEAKARVGEAIAFLGTLGPAELDAAAEQPVTLEIPDGIIFDMGGTAYIRDWALPQFYFHLVTAYAILRSHGVPLSKVDYVHHMFAYVRPGTLPPG